MALRSDAVRNQDRLVLAATAAIHRVGAQVPMATIAAEAGVGVATLYRRFPTREALLEHLTHRSFEQVLENARTAEAEGKDPSDVLRRFIRAAIGQRNELVLPLHGGPAPTSEATLVLRAEVHRILRRVIDRGVAGGLLRPGTAPRDVVVLGAMLAQPRPPDRGWDATCGRLLDAFLRGLAPD